MIGIQHSNDGIIIKINYNTAKRVLGLAFNSLSSLHFCPFYSKQFLEENDKKGF